MVLQDLRGGGAERVAVLLANGLADAGDMVTIACLRAIGPNAAAISNRVELVDLNCSRTALSLKALRRLFSTRKPDIILSHMTHMNVVTILAALLCGIANRCIAVEHNHFDLNLKLIRQRTVRAAYSIARFVYRWAAAIICVSDGVAETLERCTGLSKRSIVVIHNPIVRDDLQELSAKVADHPFFAQSDYPVVLGVGKLLPQKDFDSFLKAIASLSGVREVRAVILGEGAERPKLEKLRNDTGLKEIVDFPGYCENPYAFMAAADIFLLSSRWEGFPTVLVEALAVGQRIISTDCPSGPREILLDGMLGRLVPVGDYSAMAEAIDAALRAPAQISENRRRAADFVVETAVRRYRELFARVHK